MSLLDEQERKSFRWPVSRTAAIAAPADTVWKTIASPDSLLESHPFLAANPVKAWGNANARDEVHYLNGVVYGDACWEVKSTAPFS